MHNLVFTVKACLFTATLLTTTLLFFHSALAAGQTPASSVIARDKTETQPLSWLSQQFLNKQRQFIDQLTRSHFGQRVRGDKTDLDLLQRVVDRDLVAKNNQEGLQALGVVLGDVYVKSHEKLAWRTYEDEQGKVISVCIERSTHCLFPLTMLSRRIAVGLEVKVDTVYAKGLNLIKSELPKRPFQPK